MARTLRVLLAAEEAAGAQTLRLLHETGQHVVGVLTGRAGATGSGLLSSLAEQWGIPLWPALRVKNAAFAAEARALGVDLLLNVHSLYVVNAAVVAAPRIGSFNVHPGPLPEYAGLNAPSWAILNGEASHGVTVHWMDAGIDTGEIAYEARFEITPQETAFTLSAKCVRAALPLLRALLEAAAAEPPAIPRRRQRDVPGCYHGREVPNGGRLDWRARAEQIDRFVRAADYGPFASPWGAPLATLAGLGDVGIVKVVRTGRATDAAPGAISAPVDGGALVACANEWLLVTKVRVAGALTAAADLLAGYSAFGV